MPYLAICNEQQDVELAAAVIDDLARLAYDGSKRRRPSQPHMRHQLPARRSSSGSSNHSGELSAACELVSK